MAEVERSVYFYKVEMADGDEWKRADVLRRLDALTGEDQVLALGNDNYAWVKVDHIPRSREGGRLRFFRDRRANLPGYAYQGTIAELPIPDTAGIVEPTHLVLGGNGLIAAEYNHFAPRIPSQFSALLRSKLGLNLSIGTYVQGSILEQLDRLTYIQLLELSVVPTPGLEDDMRNAGPFGDAVASLAGEDGGRRIYLRLSGDKRSGNWTEKVRDFARKMLGAPGVEDGETLGGPGAPVGEGAAKVLRVTGYDPVAGGVEVVDLLKQKLVRRVDMERPTERSKALNTTSAYSHIDDAIREVRQSDLPSAAVAF